MFAKSHWNFPSICLPGKKLNGCLSFPVALRLQGVNFLCRQKRSPTNCKDIAGALVNLSTKIFKMNSLASVLGHLLWKLAKYQNEKERLYHYSEYYPPFPRGIWQGSVSNGLQREQSLATGPVLRASGRLTSV